jgi:UDP:flavonoid glycosyltransferase YjiC (YdhE family)
MATFLFGTDGTHGDVLQVVRLAQGLVRRGHEVTLHTHAYYREAARRAGIGFEATDTEAEYDHQLTVHRTLLVNALHSVTNIADFYREARMFDQMRRQYDAVAEVVRRQGPDEVVVVGRHSTGLAALMARESFGVPAAWLAVFPSQVNAQSLTERLFAQSIVDPVNELRATVGLPPVGDWSAWMSSVDLTMGIWPDWYDAAGAPTPETVAKVGFILNDDAETGELPADVAERVDPEVADHDRPILISGGSSMSLHENMYSAAIDGCLRAGRSAIVVCRHRDLLPQRLPDGFLWHPSLPFGTLMPHVAAVVHHGGILTCGRGMVAGVAQVVLGFGTDRPDNGRRLTRLGVGEWLPPARWDAEHIGAALSTVLTDPRYRERAARLGTSMDTAEAVSVACDRLEALLRSDSCHSSSAATGSTSPSS